MDNAETEEQWMFFSALYNEVKEKSDRL